MIAQLLCFLLQAYLVVLFGRIVLSWFPISPGSGLASVYGVLYAVTEPVLGPLRRLIPPVGVGGMGLDLSPLIIFMLITVLLGVVC